MKRRFPFRLAILLLFLATNVDGRTQTQPLITEKDRERAMVRQRFTKNFKDIQTISQGLLKEHEAKRLTARRLAKDAGSINKCGKTLRSLIGLGALAIEIDVNREIDTPSEFDESIRRLSKLIWDFAHNPVHQNSKVFNTDQAERAQTDLLAIINLSRALETKAKGYGHPANVTHQ
jgi:hypothetical protein